MEIIILKKGPCISLSLVIGVQNVKTNNRESLPANLLQLSDLTFDPCFKVKRDHYKKCPYISLVIGPGASKCENNF